MNKSTSAVVAEEDIVCSYLLWVISLVSQCRFFLFKVVAVIWSDSWRLAGALLTQRKRGREYLKRNFETCL